MANSPRAVNEILESLQNTFEDIDPTIDISKGPIAVLAYATANELSRTEGQAAYLTSVYQLAEAEDLDDSDIEALGANYGLDPNVGELSDAIATFYREAPPEAGRQYVIYEGTLVGTDDQQYTFITTNDTTMNGDTPAIYYNAEQRRYEIRAEVEAISVGDDFNLPPGTITNILSGAEGFDGVTNDEAAFGGTDPIDRTAFRNLIWANLQALDADLAGRLIIAVTDYDANASDIRLVESGEFNLFERQGTTNGRVAYDVYVLTETLNNELQTFAALGGEKFISIEKPPVQSVQYVMVDGIKVTFRFVPDTAQAFRGSPRANDRVELLSGLLEPGQTVEIKYFYYPGIVRSYNALQGRGRPYGNDVLVRLGYAVPVYIAARVSTSSAADGNTVNASIQNFTEAYLKNPLSPSTTSRRFVSLLDPKDYQDSVIANVAGIGNFTVTSFLRLDEGVQDISVIEFDGKTEYPVLAPGFITEQV